jgi:hypothetical protein
MIEIQIHHYKKVKTNNNVRGGQNNNNKTSIDNQTTKNPNFREIR